MDKSNWRTYDIRGAYPSEISKIDAMALGAAYARSTEAKNVVIGCDTRQASAALYDSFCDGVLAGGANVLDIGPCTIDLLTYGVATLEVDGNLPDGGIMVTGGRNSLDETGFKIVGREGAAVPPGEIDELMQVASSIDPQHLDPAKQGKVLHSGGDISHQYVAHILATLEPYGAWPPQPERDTFKVVIDAANPAQTALWTMINIGMPFSTDQVSFYEVGPEIKHPDPFHPSRVHRMRDRMEKVGADLGFSFDADAGGFAFYGKDGIPIEPAYVGAYLAAITAGRYADARVVVDHRTVYPMLFTANSESFETSLSIPGSAPMRYAMKSGAAHFGAGADGRFYFGDMWWTESGFMGAWLALHMAYLSPTPLHEVVAALKQGIVSFNERRFTVEHPEAVIALFEKEMSEQANTTPNKAGTELLARSKNPKLDFRVCLRKHEADGTLRFNLEGNGVAAEQMAILSAAFIDNLEKQGEPV